MKKTWVGWLVLLCCTAGFPLWVFAYTPEDSASVKGLLDSAWTVKYSDPDLAAKLIEQAAREADQAGYLRGVADARYYKAISHYLQGDYPPTFEYGQQAMALYDSLGLDPSVASIHNLFGLIHQNQGRYLEAIEAFQISSRISSRYDNPIPIANPLHNIGMVYSEIREYDRALEYFREAYELRLETGDQVFIGQSELGLGDVFYRSGQVDSSRKYLNLCIGRFRKTADNFNLGRALNILGILEMDNGNQAKAREMYDAALATMEKVEDREGKVMVLINVGLLLQGQGKFREAEPVVQSAIELARELGSLNREAEALEVLIDVRVGEKRFEEALATKVQVQALRDSLYDLEKADQFAEWETRFDVERKEKELLAERLKGELNARSFERRTGLLLVVVVLLLVLGTVLALRNRYRQRLRRQAFEAEQERTRFQALIQGEEKERSRLARELHDGLGPLLSAVKLQVSLLEGEVEGDSVEGQAIDKALDMLDHSVAEVRAVSHNLMPPSLERKGLPAALREMVRRLEGTDGPVCTVQLPDESFHLDPEMRNSLYRIAQELVNNALKHARASRIDLRLNLASDQLVLEVEDDGKGFPSGNWEMEGGMGWQNLRLRTSLLGGSLELLQPGGGSLVQVRIPRNSNPSSNLSSET